MKSFFKKVISAILQWEARLVLRKYRPKIIAITGSVGKTSTKDAIFAVLSPFFYIRKSEKSFNSEIGVPLAILGLPNAWASVSLWLKNIFSGLGLVIKKNKYPDILVLEVGADRPGDIKKISKWLSPDMAVITRFGKVPVHVEFFKSPEALIEEKSYLPRALKKEGVLILNHDDEDAMSFKKHGKEGKIVSYGFEKGADIFGSAFDIFYGNEKTGAPLGISFSARGKSGEADVLVCGALGVQHAYPVLAAFAAGESLGLSLSKMAEAVSKMENLPGRMKIIAGINNSTIIDDTYNSSPVALHEAVNTLGKIKTEGRKIAVFGDMLELGKHSVDEHRKAGEAVAGIADLLIITGVRAKDMALGALGQGMDFKKVIECENSAEAGQALKKILKDGDIALVKGSQGARMEKAVLAMMARPKEAEKLLVRQEVEWKNR